MSDARRTDLSPHTGGVSYVPPAVGQLSDAVVDGHTAPPLTQVLFGHFHPAQRSHWERLAGGKADSLSNDTGEIHTFCSVDLKITSDMYCSATGSARLRVLFCFI